MYKEFLDGRTTLDLVMAIGGALVCQGISEETLYCL